MANEIIELGNLSELDNSFIGGSRNGGGGGRSNSKSVNFGGGLELLMNDKLKSGNNENTISKKNIIQPFLFWIFIQVSRLST